MAVTTKTVSAKELVKDNQEHFLIASEVYAKTEEILKTKFSESKRHENLMKTIETSKEQTGENPIVSIQVEKLNIPAPRYIAGEKETNKLVDLYTSVSGGNNLGVWAQTNAYLNDPSISTVITLPGGIIGSLFDKKHPG